jgi:hypothetical protein
VIEKNLVGVPKKGGLVTFSKTTFEAQTVLTEFDSKDLLGQIS